MKKILLSTIAVLALSAPAAMAEHGSGHPEKGARMMEKLDTDKNGVISKEEFISEAEARFAEIDKDNSGSVTQEEVQAKAAEWKAQRAEMKAKKEAEKPAEAAPEAAPAETAPAPESAE